MDARRVPADEAERQGNGDRGGDCHCRNRPHTCAPAARVAFVRERAAHALTQVECRLGLRADNVREIGAWQRTRDPDELGELVAATLATVEVCAQRNLFLGLEQSER
jgi:hypothetical protein